MRNIPVRNAETNSIRDGVLLLFNQRDAEIVRNWPNTALNKDRGKA